MIGQIGKYSKSYYTGDSEESLEEDTTATLSKTACKSFKDLLKPTCKHDSDTDESLTSDFQPLNAFELFTELQVRAN